MLISGKFVAIEVKSEKGVQSDAQKKKQALIEKCGGYYHLARSVCDVQRVVSSYTNLIRNDKTTDQRL